MRKIFLGLAAMSVAAAPFAANAASRMQQRQMAETPQGAQSSGVRTGTLQCDVSAGAGFIIGSSREVNCTYKADGARMQRYVGSINRIGLDVGVTSKAVMVWNVVAPTTEQKGQSLAGKYRGVSGGASVGVGGSANVLVASNTGFNLQPVSVGGQRGINLAAGVGTLSLRPADRG